MDMKKIFVVMAGILLAVSCTNVQKVDKPGNNPESKAENKQDNIQEEVIDSVQFVEPQRTAQEWKGIKYRIAIGEIDEEGSTQTFCYAENLQTNKKEKLFFSGADYDDCMNDGYGDLWGFASSDGRYVFVVGDIKPNSNGWTERFLIYRIDTNNLKIKLMNQVAAVQPLSNGYRVAAARITNPDALCTAEELWLMHDVYYNFKGKVISRDRHEYDYNEMVKRYPKSF